MLARTTRLNLLKGPVIRPLLGCNQHFARMHDGWPTRAEEEAEAAKELQRHAATMRDAAMHGKPIEALQTQQQLAAARLRDAIHDTTEKIEALENIEWKLKDQGAINRLKDLEISVVEKHDLATTISNFGRIIESEREEHEVAWDIAMGHVDDHNRYIWAAVIVYLVTMGVGIYLYESEISSYKEQLRSYRNEKNS